MHVISIDITIHKIEYMPHRLAPHINRWISYSAVDRNKTLIWVISSRMASIQEVRYQERLSELVLSGHERMNPLYWLLKLIHEKVEAWYSLEPLILALFTASKVKPFQWHKILPKLKRKQKKRSKCVHGRLTYWVSLPSSRVTCTKRSVNGCPGRRCSRPVGSCWAGKGACLQDFYSDML